MGKYVPPPAGLKPPFLWGIEERLRELFGEGIASLQTERRNFAFRYPSAEYYAGFMCSYHVPLYKTFEALDEEN